MGYYQLNKSLEQAVKSNKGKTVAFLPTDIANIAVWLRADKGITTSGGAVSQWDFENGTFRGVDKVSQGTGANQPTHIVSDAAYNNRSVISFDGTDWLDTIAFSSPIAQPNTIFIVGDASAIGGAERNFFLQTPNLDASGDVNSFENVSSGWRISAGVNLTGGTEDTNVNLFEAIYNGVSSSLDINGSNVLSGNTGADPMKDMRVGNHSNGVIGLTGKIAEIIVYNALLSAGDRTLVRSYLNMRYNVY